MADGLLIAKEGTVVATRLSEGVADQSLPFQLIQVASWARAPFAIPGTNMLVVEEDSLLSEPPIGWLIVEVKKGAVVPEYIEAS